MTTPARLVAVIAPGIEELDRRAVIAIRNPVSSDDRSATDRIAADLGLPTAAPIGRVRSDGGVALLAIGPDDLWILASLEREAELLDLAERAMATASGAAIVLSDALVAFRIHGRGAADVLAQGTELDLHDREFGVGRVTRTLLGVVPVVLVNVGGTPGPVYEIFVEASYAEWLRDWLVVAGAARE